MSRRDVVENKTLGESLLYFICSVATGTHVQHHASATVCRTAMAMVHSHLFTPDCKSDYEQAQLLDTAFTQLAKTNLTLTFDEQEFLYKLAVMCYDYVDLVQWFDSQEAPLPF